MGHHHYSSVRWKNITSSLRRMTQWERKCSFIASPEVYGSNQHVATSLLAVVTLWLIVRGTKKQIIKWNNNGPLHFHVKTAVDVCKPLYFSLKLGVFMISLISNGILQYTNATCIKLEYSTGHISIPPNFVGNLMQVLRDCHMGCLEYYSLRGLACCRGHLILLLLLCGDVEVNPGPYEEGQSK